MGQGFCRLVQLLGGFLQRILFCVRILPGRFERNLLAMILVYLLYGNILFLCRTWVGEGLLPAYIGLWWVHIFFIVITFVWIRRQGRFRDKSVLSV